MGKKRKVVFSHTAIQPLCQAILNKFPRKEGERNTPYLKRLAAWSIKQGYALSYGMFYEHIFNPYWNNQEVRLTRSTVQTLAQLAEQPELFTEIWSMAHAPDPLQSVFGRYQINPCGTCQSKLSKQTLSLRRKHSTLTGPYGNWKSRRLHYYAGHLYLDLESRAGDMVFLILQVGTAPNEEHSQMIKGIATSVNNDLQAYGQLLFLVKEGSKQQLPSSFPENSYCSFFE